MNGEHKTIITEKRNYRRRRIADAARLLPVFGVVFFSIPLLWPGAADGSENGGTSTTSAMLYIFGIWVILVAVSAVISRHLRPEESDSSEQAQG